MVVMAIIRVIMVIMVVVMVITVVVMVIMVIMLIMVIIIVIGTIYRQGYLRTELGLCVPFFTTRALSDASEGSKEPLRALQYRKRAL